ncbi:plasmid mobilization relaxosome protein MobC [Chitinivorax sp. PXF-14]|uniref:plasmid mobilization relaxosome protein MobC n=1 Tax=Chitinivorax sp. PXF-14 TaxID=3230488 RepID=UPI003465F1A0
MKKETKDETIIIRCTRKEKEFIKLTATLKEFKSISDYLLASTIYPQSLDKKKAQSMLYEVNKIGVNLNQISRKINQFELTDPLEIIQYLELINSQLEEVVRVYKEL